MRASALRFTTALGALFSAAALAGPAHAAELIEVNVESANRKVTIASFDPIGQSFTAISDTLTSIGFEFSTLNPTAANSAITLDIFAGETLSGTSLFSTSFFLPASIVDRSVEEFVDIALPNIAVSNGNLYTAVLNTTSNRAALVTGPGFVPQTGMFLGGDAYSGGQLLAGGRSLFSNCLGETNNCDANFRVTGELVAGAVPEPATWALMLLGFALAGGALRTVRAAAARETQDLEATPA
ncbi:MAG: PEPxxWA-CTERM sorting domain-containing protein [Erythrobacter sp.]|jgi:hypothetical protein|nr:PEPxxWA-CTERM sorting domain-containing protein [Erythrobacter sp.]